jgi:hypothetical protein
MKQHTILDINNTAELSVPMREVQSIEPTTLGKFRSPDIINYIRQFLTDDDLLHFKQLSSVFLSSGGFLDELMKWHEPIITMSDLSITRQLSIYKRIEKKHANTRDLFMSSRWFYYYIPYHCFSYFGPYGQPLPSKTFTPYVLKDKHNTPFSKIELEQVQEKADELFANFSIPYSEKELFIYLPYRLLLKLNKAAWRLFCLFLLIGPPLIFYLTYKSTRENYQCNQLSNRADIKILQMNIWTGNYISNLVSCNTALTNTTISFNKNFSQLMYMSGFSFNVTNLTLAACLTLFSICRNNGDHFLDHLMTVNDQIMVGCHHVYDGCTSPKADDTVMLILGTFVLMPSVSVIFGCIALCFFNSYFYRRRVLGHIRNFFDVDVIEKLQEAQDSYTIVQRSPQNKHPSLTEDIGRSQVFFKTIREKIHLEIQHIESKEKEARVPMLF